MAAEPHGAQGVSAAQQSIEHISHGDQCLAIVIRTNFVPQKTTFLTPSDYKQQIGFIVYPAGGEVPRHVHRPLTRQLVGTSEVLLVRQGHCVADIYNDERELVTSRTLCEGDVILLVAGGHGFRMLADTVLLEVKQGPYTGIEEKERF
jgi:hypothetical protein